MSETTDQVETRPSRSSPASVYVGNLFFEVTDEQLKEEFSRFGEVTGVKIVKDNRGLSKGFGFVNYQSQEAAKEAVRRMDDYIFLGRRITVQIQKARELLSERASMQRSSGPTKTLFIGNMSYQMSDRDLNDLFRDIAQVTDVRVAIDRRSGQPRGFAHADFTTTEAAATAKDVLREKVIYGRQLRVDFTADSKRN